MKVYKLHFDDHTDLNKNGVPRRVVDDRLFMNKQTVINELTKKGYSEQENEFLHDTYILYDDYNKIKILAMIFEGEEIEYKEDGEVLWKDFKLG